MPGCGGNVSACRHSTRALDTGVRASTDLVGLRSRATGVARSHRVREPCQRVGVAGRVSEASLPCLFTTEQSGTLRLPKITGGTPVSQ
jgi:hypothetical protein